jgi:hypothetical protein
MLYDGELARWEAALLLVGLGGYIAMLIFGEQELDDELPQDPMTWRDPLWLVAGVVGVVGGGEMAGGRRLRPRADGRRQRVGHRR